MGDRGWGEGGYLRTWLRRTDQVLVARREWRYGARMARQARYCPMARWPIWQEQRGERPSSRARSAPKATSIATVQFACDSYRVKENVGMAKVTRVPWPPLPSLRALATTTQLAPLRPSPRSTTAPQLTLSQICRTPHPVASLTHPPSYRVIVPILHPQTNISKLTLHATPSMPSLSKVTVVRTGNLNAKLTFKYSTAEHSPPTAKAGEDYQVVMHDG